MESSKEKIEAQLCAYVDGELDDAERAEIERHLAANPQHKALISELRAASGLLRGLPRVAIPEQLNENLTGQLERSSLLDPHEETQPRRGVLGFSRWSQLTAVAAVLLLAGGLGYVVYYVLPPANASKGPVAMDDKAIKLGRPTTDGAPPATLLADADHDGAPADAEAKSKKMAAANDFKEAALEAPAQNKPVQTNPVPSLEYEALGANRGVTAAPTARDLDVARTRSLGDNKDLVTPAEVESFRRRMSISLGADNMGFNLGGSSSLYLIVSTPNVAVANTQLAAYFKTTGIQYMSDVDPGQATPPSTALAENESQRALGGGRGGNPKQYAFGTATAGRAGGAGFGGGGGNAPGFGRQPTDKADQPNPPSENPSSASSASAGGSSAAALNRADQPPTPDAYAKDRQPASGPAPAAAGVTTTDDLAKSKSPAAPDSNASAAAADAAGRAELNQVLTKASEAATTPPPAPAAAGAPAAAAPTAPGIEHLPSIASTWGMKTEGLGIKPARDDALAGHTVIIARMNRRQAGELSATLSREPGQRAELREAIGAAVAQTTATPPPPSAGAAPSGPVTPLNGALTLEPNANLHATDAAKSVAETRALEDALVQGRRTESVDRAAGASTPTAAPTTHPTAAAAAATATTDALRLKVDPLEEPVDVVIVVKPDPTPAVAAPAAIAPTPALTPDKKP